ncbi:MAG: MerR family transcriptional regulator [Actinomycetes bacterium]
MSEQLRTVSELARLSAVTVRTLHHYDDIGLLVPTARSDVGYRLYDDADVQRLAQIVAYRAVGMSLTDIEVVLSTEGDRRAAHLRRQLELLDQRQDLIARQRQVLVSALEAISMGINLDPDEVFEVFGEDDPRQYEAEAAERWGESDAYAESWRRTSAYTKADWQRAQAEAEAIVAEFVRCKGAGLPPDSTEAMAAAERHRQNITKWYYDCTYEMQVGLAEMYLADARFMANYERLMPGLTAYVHDSIVANATRD